VDLAQRLEELDVTNIARSGLGEMRLEGLEHVREAQGLARGLELVGRVRARFRRAGRSGSLISESRCQPMFEQRPLLPWFVPTAGPR